MRNFSVLMRPSGRQRRLVMLVLAALAFGIALVGGSRYRHHKSVAPAISGVAIHPPSPVPPPDSGEDPGSPLSKAALADHWSLLMLDPHRGQARSPSLIHLLQVHNRLAAEPTLQQQLHYLYLPRESDDASLQAISDLGDNISGLSLDPAQMDETFRRFGADPGADEAVLYLIDPEVKLHALFTPGEDAATIAKDLVTLITASQ
jgi:hypothetical protein